MISDTALPRFAAVVVAAGRGLRAGGEKPKQFQNWRGKPLLRHSVEALAKAGCGQIVLVVPAGTEEQASDAAGRPNSLITIAGGATRQQSVLAGLEALEDLGFEKVLIHDAARPNLLQKVIERLLRALESSFGAIPVLPVVDSLAIDHAGQMAGSADREMLRRVQTPQAFHLEAILSAHRKWRGKPNAGDDAQVFAAAGGKVALVDGDERLKKMTFEQDFSVDTPLFRIGQGFDVHRLTEGEELWLCGLKIDHEKGLVGHSDADVALHAVVDALLGAIGAGDIGTHFPPSDPQWKGAASHVFLSHAVNLVRNEGYNVGNLDVTLICEEPKIGPHRDAMRGRLAELLGVALEQVSLKATTTERLGFTGRGEGIAAQAIVSLQTG